MAYDRRYRDNLFEAEVPELTRLFLEEIIAHSPTELMVTFLDGSKIKVKL